MNEKQETYKEIAELFQELARAFNDLAAFEEPEDIDEEDGDDE